MPLLHRDPEAQYFCTCYDCLLEEAWHEWAEEGDGASLPAPDTSLYHLQLREAIDTAWENSRKETAIRNLWKEVAPGVYQCPFFDPTRLN